MAANSDTLYLKIEQNVLVREPSVVLKREGGGGREGG